VSAAVTTLVLLEGPKTQETRVARFPYARTLRKNAKTSINTGLSRFQECKSLGKMRLGTLVTLGKLPNPGRGGENLVPHRHPDTPPRRFIIDSSFES